MATKRKKTKPLTKREAMQRFVYTHTLSTDMLEPLGISMDTFLSYAQKSDADVKVINNKLAAIYQAELDKV